MGDPAFKLPSYDDLLALPENVTGEILDGTLHTSPRPASRHGSAEIALGSVLWSQFGRQRGGPGGWVILPEPELHLGADVLVPDLAGWRRERMPELPDTPAFDLAPDWVCEILSPSTVRRDRGVKLRAYARHGVPFVWLVDPAAQLVEVLVLTAGSYRIEHTVEADATVRLPPFEALELQLADLWAR